MQPTIEILDRIRKNSRDNKEEIFTRLYRYLLRPDLYYLAYKNLYANKGAGTKGVNDDTADGFSKEKVDRIIQSLADGTYTPNPVRRKYIQKKQNSTKKRPLGIPTFTDKLVQAYEYNMMDATYREVQEEIEQNANAEEFIPDEPAAIEEQPKQPTVAEVVKTAEKEPV